MPEMLEQAFARLLESLGDAGLFRPLQGRSRVTAEDCLKIGFWAGAAAARVARSVEAVADERDSGGVPATGS